jgi:hypothetical protein
VINTERRRLEYYDEFSADYRLTHTPIDTISPPPEERHHIRISATAEKIKAAMKQGNKTVLLRNAENPYKMTTIARSDASKIALPVPYHPQPDSI